MADRNLKNRYIPEDWDEKKVNEVFKKFGEKDGKSDITSTFFQKAEKEEAGGESFLEDLRSTECVFTPTRFQARFESLVDRLGVL